MKSVPLPIDEQLIEHPYGFSFFQAVRLLALILHERPSLGTADHPADEIARFKVRQSLEFPPSSIHALDIEQDPPRMTVAFMGLTGVQGVLPHHYTEYIIARAMAKDFALAEFLDLFNHRLISLFYRAWEKYNFPVRFQLGEARKQSDSVTDYLLDIVGLGLPGLRDRLSVGDQSLLLYAGLFAQAPRSATALACILRDYFGIPIEIEQNIGCWYQLQPEDCCDLGGSGINNQLGEGAIAGDAVWDPQASFSIKMGPLGLVHYLEFLPDAEPTKKLRDIVRLFAGTVLQIEWQPVLRAEEVPSCRLGDETPAGPRLGWTSWLKTEEFTADADDARFALA